MSIRLLSHSLIVAGVILLFISILTGNTKFGIFIIFPFIYGYGLLSALSFLLIMIGIFLWFIPPYEAHTMHATEDLKFENVKSEKHFGGVILIGPIPIIFGSDKNMALVSLLTTVSILLLIFLFFLFFFP